MTFKVMKERCNECLFGPNKIVSDARRAEILRKIAREDSHFVCHKATIAGQDIACRGDFDQFGCGQMGRIAGRLGAIEFVDEPPQPVAQAPKRKARQDRLSPAARKALESARDHGNPCYHLKGRSAHGGYTATQTVLVRNHWIDVHGKITEAGRKALEDGK